MIYEVATGVEGGVGGEPDVRGTEQPRAARFAVLPWLPLPLCCRASAPYPPPHLMLQGDVDACGLQTANVEVLPYLGPGSIPGPLSTAPEA